MPSNESRQGWKRALFCLVSLVGAIGCADGAKLGTGETATERQILTFPVTITLSTPNPVAPTAPVLVGSNIVRLGARSEVVSGMTVAMGTAGLTTEPDALLNETWSRGTAVLKDRVTVRGTLHARTRTLGTGVVITASDLSPAIDPPSTLSWQVNYPPGPANNLTLNSGGAQTLLPGKHGIITLNSQSTLTLQTGTYYLDTLSVQSASVVKLDQARGPVIVYTKDSVTLRGAFTPLVGTAPPDLLIAHLGTTPVLVETPFNGAIIAPWASLTFRAVSGIHTGYFAAHEPILDAFAKVRYRAPLAVITASKPSGTTCGKLLAGLVPEADLFRYCDCPTPAVDSDADGAEDCVDECPSDANKKLAGKSGCGIPDTDRDNDGVPDSKDQCDVDPNNTTAGECGCVRRPTEIQDLKPSGFPCRNTACPQLNATCNGAGVCGNRSACVVATGCKLITNYDTSYWFCPGPLTRSAAALACRGKQLHLARIDSIAETQFVQQYVTGPAWIGANSIATSGVWRWSTPTSDAGDQFWQGTTTGVQRNSLFSHWKRGVAPASQRCAVVQPGDGRWVDVDCNQALGYVCEAPPPVVPATPLPRLPGEIEQPLPPTKACVDPADSGLPEESPTGLDQLRGDYDAAGLMPPVLRGAAAAPPDSGTCPFDASTVALGDFDAGAGCRLNRVATTPADFECTTDQSCAPFGTGLFCRFVQDDLSCQPDASRPDVNDRDGGCVGHARCGRIECPANAFPNRCDQIEICNPGTTEDAGEATGSDLIAEPFDPAGMFDAGLPDAASVGSYNDPAEGTGKNHSWCFMNVEKPIPEAVQPEAGKQGAGSTSDVSFRFDPNLTFKANVNPLSLGETDLDIHASAELIAGVAVNDLFGSGLGFDKDILRAVADIRALRCSVGNDASEFEVFGVDFITVNNPYIFNTAQKPIKFITDDDTGMPLDLVEETTACNEAVGRFITFANRAKKAYRDAQQLLRQYHQLKDAGQHLGTLCQDVMNLVGSGGQVAFFPGGLECPANEPAEITIQRFLDYYQAPGFGQISQLRDAITNLVNQTDRIIGKLKFEQRIPLFDPGKSESQTIINVPFAIGPVPMLLQVDAFYGYGVRGFFEIGVKFPFNPLKDEVGDIKEIAHVRAGVMPYANAGLSAFVGAGTNLGAFSAALGIEGQITLAKLKAPIFAGAGISAEITADKRPFDVADQQPVSLATNVIGLDKITHFGIPTALKFHVWYDYGAGLHVADILKGQLNATLRIKFFFFSRTWRKQIVAFNGFNINVNFLSGKAGSDPGVGLKRSETLEPNDPDASTTQTVQGTTPLGLSEPEAPLAILVPVEPAATPLDPDASVHFDASAVEQIFYDNQCCARPTDPLPPDVTVDQCLVNLDGGANRSFPGGPVPCCPGFVCSVGIDRGTRCVPPPTQCAPLNATCDDNSDCCESLFCNLGEQVCVPCIILGEPCEETAQCCGGPSGVNKCFIDAESSACGNNQ
jgi:hypothetical protein